MCNMTAHFGSQTDIAMQVEARNRDSERERERGKGEISQIIGVNRATESTSRVLFALKI